MATSLMPLPKQHYTGISGVPLIGGKVYTYAAGTTTPKQTFSDAAGTIPQTNPIILNARGEPASAIYWSGNYKVEVRDAFDNLIYIVDDYNTDPSGVASGFAAFVASLASSIGSTLVGFIHAGAGAVLRTVQMKLRDFRSITDYGAISGGEEHAAVNDAAFIAALAQGNVLIPEGDFAISKTIKIPSNRKIWGFGYKSRVYGASTFVPTVMGWAGGPLPVVFANDGIESSASNTNIEIDNVYSDWTVAPGQAHHVHFRNTTGCRVRNSYFRAGADGTAFTMSSDYQVTGNTAWDTRNCAYDQWENSHDGLVANNIAHISFGYGMLATGDTSLNTPGTTYGIHFVNNQIHGDGTSNSGIGLWLQSGSNATSVCHSCVAVGNRFDGFDVCIRLTGGGRHTVTSNRGYNGKVSGISLSAEVAGFGTMANIIGHNQLEICGNAASAPIHVQDNSGSNIIEGNRSVNHNGANYAVILEASAFINTVRNNDLDAGTIGVVIDVSGRNNTDYEQSFVPTLVSSGGGIPTYGTVYGNAQKIGRRVFFNLRINITGLGSLGAGNLTVAGLPWTSLNDTADDVSPAASTFSNANAALAAPPLARVPNNAVTVELLKWVGGTIAPLTLADITATTVINISGNYRYR